MKLAESRSRVKHEQWNVKLSSPINYYSILLKYSHSSCVGGAEGEQRESIFVDVGSDRWQLYLLRFFVRDGWLSGRVVFDFARLVFVLNDILLDGLLVGTISRMKRHWSMSVRFQYGNVLNSLLIVLVSSGSRTLSIDALIFDNVVRIVICVGLRCISIGFVWNSCVVDKQRDWKMFPLVQVNPHNRSSSVRFK